MRMRRKKLILCKKVSKKVWKRHYRKMKEMSIAPVDPKKCLN
jgi:hypothetical protein